MENFMELDDFRKRDQEIENYYYFNNGFTDEEIEKIIKMGENLKEIDGIIGTNDKPTEYRNSKIKWLYCNEENKWLFKKMKKYVKEANNAMWNFDIVGFGEAFQLGTYVSNNKGHYDWHLDCDSTNPFRKISLSVQLTDPSEYEGGELQLYTKKNIQTLPKTKGAAIFFPSFLLHQVTPVTKGKRMSLVAWVTGPQFK